MKQILSSLLAGLVVLAGSIAQLPLSSAVQSILSVVVAVLVAALTSYLADGGPVQLVKQSIRK